MADNTRVGVLYPDADVAQDVPIRTAESEISERPAAWFQAIGTFVVYTATWGLLSSYGSYQSYYESDLLASESTANLSWIGTIEGVLLIMSGIVTGPIFDRGRIRELLYLGSFLTVFGVMMLSLSTKYWQVMLAQGWCIGIGSGIIFTPCIALVASSFNKHRALAICFATCGTAIGGILYPIVLERLLPKIGFAWSTRFLGLITLVELLLALALILPHVEKPQVHTPRGLFEWSALKEPTFAAFCAALFFMWVAYWVPFFMIPTFAEYRVRTSASLSFYILVVNNAAIIPGRFLAVLVCDKVGVSEGLLSFSFFSGILLYAWIAVESVPSLIAWCVMLGLFLAPLAVFVPALLPAICPSKDVIGTRMGMAWTAAAMGIVLGAPLSGALVDTKTGSFWRMQVLVGTCMMVGSGCQLFVHLQLKKQKKI